MAGRLAGIGRHDRPKGPIETVESVSVTAAAGINGDHRGALAALKPERRRQVSLIERDSWDTASSESGCSLEWWNSRRNLLVEGLRLPREEGARIAIGNSLVIEVTCECDPCERMDALHMGLREALTPDWRGGVLGRVIADGEIAVGDEIRIVA